MWCCGSWSALHFQQLSWCWKSPCIEQHTRHIHELPTKNEHPIHVNSPEMNTCVNDSTASLTCGFFCGQCPLLLLLLLVLSLGAGRLLPVRGGGGQFGSTEQTFQSQPPQSPLRFFNSTPHNKTTQDKNDPPPLLFLRSYWKRPRVSVLWSARVIPHSNDP